MTSRPPRVVVGESGGVVVRVHVVPRAGRDEVVGRHGDALKIRVRAPAVDGRATEAAGTVLADCLGVAPCSVTLRSGAASRTKRFAVSGPSVADVEQRLAGWLRPVGGTGTVG